MKTLKHFDEQMFDSTEAKNIGRSHHILDVPQESLLFDDFNFKSTSITRIEMDCSDIFSPLGTSEEELLDMHDLHAEEPTRNKVDFSDIPSSQRTNQEESQKEFVNIEDLRAKQLTRNEMDYLTIPVPPSTSMEELMSMKDLNAEKFFHVTRMSKTLFDNLSELVSSPEYLAITLK